MVLNLEAMEGASGLVDHVTDGPNRTLFTGSGHQASRHSHPLVRDDWRGSHPCGFAGSRIPASRGESPGGRGVRWLPTTPLASRSSESAGRAMKLACLSPPPPMRPSDVSAPQFSRQPRSRTGASLYLVTRSGPFGGHEPRGEPLPEAAGELLSSGGQSDGPPKGRNDA